MVEKFKNILNMVIKNKGAVTLFAILKMDDLTDKWSIVITAPWINDKNHNETFEYLRDLIVKELSLEESASIARIGIFPRYEHVVEALLKYKEGSVIQTDEKINGNIVHEAYILASDGSI
jgi:hypothetical protein